MNKIQKTASMVGSLKRYYIDDSKKSIASAYAKKLRKLQRRLPIYYKMEKNVEAAQKEIDSGETVGPFDSAEEAIVYLKNL